MKKIFLVLFLMVCLLFVACSSKDSNSIESSRKDFYPYGLVGNIAEIKEDNYVVITVKSTDDDTINTGDKILVKYNDIEILKYGADNEENSILSEDYKLKLGEEVSIDFAPGEKVEKDGYRYFNENLNVFVDFPKANG